MTNRTRFLRKNVNLVSKMRKKKMENDSVMFIGKRRGMTMYYVADYDKNTVMWSTRKENSMWFSTEDTALKFLKTRLKDRKDVMLVVSKKP